jgi:hypothetical protein
MPIPVTATSLARSFLGPLVGLLVAIVAIVAVPTAGAQGVSGPAFYVDGVLYRTVGTPTDLTRTGAPAHSFDTIYDFGGLQPNVATAAPGDRGYNGGRWMVRGLTFPNYDATRTNPAVDLNGNQVLDSDEEVRAAIALGLATDGGVIRRFECPVIKVPRNHP